MASNKVDLRKLERDVADYTHDRPLYEVFADVLMAALSRAVKDLGTVPIVQARAKSIPSYAEKVLRKKDHYPHPVYQMTDLCGARVITECTDDIHPVCEFIEAHFEIDESGREDVSARLRAGEFGYRSIHYIVSLRPDEFDDVIESVIKAKRTRSDKSKDITKERFFERWSEDDDEVKAGHVAPGPKYKAEIQLLSLLGHAWSTLTHDRVYKGNLDLPRSLKRDANRIAAVLEEAGAAFTQVLRGIDGFKTYYGPYMPREQRKEELETLEAMLAYDKRNARLALKTARMAASLDNYTKTEQLLKPFVGTWKKSDGGHAFQEHYDVLRKDQASPTADQREQAERGIHDLQDPLTAAILTEYGRAKNAQGRRDARRHVEWAAELDRSVPDAHIVLAKMYAEVHDTGTALKHYENATEIDASDPRAVHGLVYFKLIRERQAGFVPLVRSQMERAIERCHEWAAAKAYVPQVFYNIGLFELLLGRPYASLSAYAKAVQMTDTDEHLQQALDQFKRLQKELDCEITGLDWLWRFLCVARPVRLDQLARKLDKQRADAKEELNRVTKKLGKLSDGPEKDQAIAEMQKAKRQLDETREGLADLRSRAKSAWQTLAEMRKHDLSGLSDPVVFVLGGCDARVEVQMQEYRPLLKAAFAGYRGAVVSGGTTAGISGLVGDLPNPSSGTNGIEKISYLPADLPKWTGLHDEYTHYPSGGERFSPLETIQLWIDLLVAKKDPTKVKVLGIDGGEITGVDFRISIVLGAKVGALSDSGRAAADILDDEDWQDAPGLLALPRDLYTVRSFIQATSESTCLSKEHRKKMARQRHKQHTEEKINSLKKEDESLADWDDLGEGFRESNYQQIDHMEVKLREVGLKFQRVAERPIELYQLSDEQVELMAEMEHGRWNAERLLSGWKLGKKDPKEKKSPYLVSWSDLPADIREWDRIPIREMPEKLQKYGYKVVPAPKSPPSSERADS